MLLKLNVFFIIHHDIPEREVRRVHIIVYGYAVPCDGFVFTLTIFGSMDSASFHIQIVIIFFFFFFFSKAIKTLGTPSCIDSMLSDEEQLQEIARMCNHSSVKATVVCRPFAP